VATATASISDYQQPFFDAAAKKISSKVRCILRKSGSSSSEKRNAFDFGQRLAGTFKQDAGSTRLATSYKKFELRNRCLN